MECTVLELSQERKETYPMHTSSCAYQLANVMKILQKNRHLLLIVLYISVRSHIQIHYILAATKKVKNTNSFKGKNLLEFCFFRAKI